MHPEKLIPSDLSNIPNPFKANLHVDPELLTLINEGVRRFKELHTNLAVEVYGPASGVRTGKHSSNHGIQKNGYGAALDIRIKNIEDNHYYENYQVGSTAPLYQELANFVKLAQEKYYPKKKIRWGGYFSGTRKTYGALDEMHFDSRGHVGMAGGSWEYGFTQTAMKYWKIDKNCGMKEFRKLHSY